MSNSAKVAYWQARCRELEAEIVRLSGKTGFCAQCEQYAKKIEAMKSIGDRMAQNCKALGAFGIAEEWEAVK
mgnify:CR=1 FL=1